MTNPDQARIVIKVKSGKALSLRISADLDSTYLRMFKRAVKRVRNARVRTRTTPITEPAVEVVVFGALFVEAQLNEALFDVLEETTGATDLSRTLWDALKRGSLDSKGEVIAEIAGGHLRWQYGRVRKKLKRLTELRNQLVHLKDLKAVEFPSKKPVDEAIELLPVFLAIPGVDILKNLRKANILAHANTVYAVMTWLGRVGEAVRNRTAKIEKARGEARPN